MMLLVNNPIANMYGPYFLLFYAIVAFLVCFSCWLKLQRIDPHRLPVGLMIPPEPDPYEITYMRGGKTELIRLLIFELIQEKFLLVKDGTTIEKNPDYPRLIKLPKIKQMVFNWFSQPSTAAKILNAKDKLADLDIFTKNYEKVLYDYRLLNSPQVYKSAWQLWLGGSAILTALALYKIVIAVMNGHFNIIFLIFMYIASLIVLGSICKRSYLSRGGKLYLEKLRTAFQDLKTDAALRKDSSLDTGTILAMGIFGFGVLGSAAYAENFQLFRRVATDTDYSGAYTSSGFSTGSSCSGSSCSSGDSGSSSCGGGGCGGCGGGGGD